MRLLKAILFIFTIGLYSSLYAWDSNGHKLVAEIAYENLTPNAKKSVLEMLKTPGPEYKHPLSFSNSAAWADWIRSNLPEYNSWHYINIPYCDNDSCFKQKTASPNIVTAILLDAAIVQNKLASAIQKGEALRFYMHWLGDIHQPMHSITYYSKDYVEGDAGGNRYALHDNPYPNLHAYWDGGCGLWPKNKSLNRKQLQSLAKVWQAQYPKKEFTAVLAHKDPLSWAKDSHALAVEYAYKAAPKHYLTVKAQKNAQIICQKQITLAGYRLAQNLNAWYSAP